MTTTADQEREDRHWTRQEDHWDDPANPDLWPTPAPPLVERDEPVWVGPRRCAHRDPRPAGLQPVRCPRFTDGAPLCPEHGGKS